MPRRIPLRSRASWPHRRLEKGPSRSLCADIQSGTGGMTPLSLGVDLAQGDPVLAGDAGAVLEFRRENRRLPVPPAELALNRAPGRRHLTRPRGAVSPG